MPLDASVQRLLAALAAGDRADTPHAGVMERRAGLSRLLELGRRDFAVADVEDGTLPGPAGALGIRAYRAVGAASSASAGLIYFHGGGLVAGSIDSHDCIARALCHYSLCRVISVGYRLAPEAPFPAALEDAQAAVLHIAHHARELGIDPRRLALCGDSAGGTLAAVTAQRLAAAGGPPLALQVLLCPILDHSRRSASRIELERGFLIDAATLEDDLRHYLPSGITADDPRVSPLCAQRLDGAPPALVHTAEFDPLRDEALDYFGRLTQSGAGLSYTCHAGMVHMFYGLAALIPYARVALEQIGHEIRTALD